MTVDCYIQSINKQYGIYTKGDMNALYNILLKKKYMNNKDKMADTIRPLLIVMPGVMRGVTGGGQVTALSDMGLIDTFTAAIGISTGAPTALYFVSGQSRLGTSIYYDDLPKCNFLSVRRFFRGGPFMDVNKLCDIFDGSVGSKMLDIDFVIKSRTKTYVTVAEYNTGKVSMMPINTEDTAFVYLKASISMPVLCKDKIFIDGTRYMDGGLIMKVPSEDMIKSINPTDVIILANRDINVGTSILMKIFLYIFSLFLTAEVKEKVRRDDAAMRKDLDDILNNKDYRSIVIYGGVPTPYTLKSDRLRKCAENAYNHMTALLRHRAVHFDK